MQSIITIVKFVIPVNHINNKLFLQFFFSTSRDYIKIYIEKNRISFYFNLLKLKCVCVFVWKFI